MPGRRSLENCSPFNLVIIMAKIGFVLEEFRGGGAEKSVLTLSEYMVARGHEVHLFIWGHTFDYQVSPRLTLHRLNHNGSFQQYEFLDHSLLALNLRRAVVAEETRNGRFDLIACTVWPANRITYLSQLERAVIRIANTPSCELNTLRKMSGEQAALERRELYHQMFRGLPLVAISEGVRNDLVNQFGVAPGQVTVIHNPADPDRIARLADEPASGIPDEDYIVHVARFAPQKRHDLLFTAFKQLRTKVKLVLLTKHSPALCALIAEHGLEDRVVCPGFQRNPYPWMKRARLSVLCSDHEGFGNVILESLICATPVVSTDCPSGPSEILAGPLRHWLVQKDDAPALAAKIDEALHTDIAIPANLAEKFALDTAMRAYLSMAVQFQENTRSNTYSCLHT